MEQGKNSLDDRTNQRVSKHEIILTDKKSKKGLKIVLITVGALLAVAIAVGVLVWLEILKANRSDAVNTYVVIAPGLNIVEKTKNDAGKTEFRIKDKAPFGTLVKLADEQIQLDNKTYFKIDPAESDGKYKGFYIETHRSNDLEREFGYTQNDYLKMFCNKEAIELPSDIKTSIFAAVYKDNSSDFHFTLDANRSVKQIVFADFNMDGEQDVAVIVENADYRINRLYLMCYNSDIKQYYQEFTDNNSGWGIINKFNKNALIYINSEHLVKAPNSGLIYEMLRGKGETPLKYAIFYDPKTMQFNQYYQAPASRITEEEEYEAEECCDDESEGVFEEDLPVEEADSTSIATQ
ncbi:MAG: hypothetical protein LBS01_05360 [Prevotellaceae bacterium]|jgi:hypothetical protein|nr:hypothetical protein [Prevotellaceae bacterium]